MTVAKALLQKRRILWIIFILGIVANIYIFRTPVYGWFSEGRHYHLGRFVAQNIDENHKTHVKDDVQNQTMHVKETQVPEAEIPPSPQGKQSTLPPVVDHGQSNNLTWLVRRQALLKADGPRKVFLFSHMRGGSTIAGELFNVDPHATMWYEPGDAFFSYYYGLSHENLPQHDLYFKNMTRRPPDRKEQEAMSDFYSNMFSCDYNSLPPEALGHYFNAYSRSMDGYTTCMNITVENPAINNCRSHISGICGEKLVEVSLSKKCHLVIEMARHIVDENIYIRNESKLLSIMHHTYQDFISQLDLNVKQNLKSFILHEFCLRTIRNDNDKCMNIALKRCRSDNVRVVQVNRMKMEDLSVLMEKNPDIHVIHYIRDPRAICLSRVATHHMVWNTKNQNPVVESKVLCPRMQEDLHQRHLLEKKYPGAFMEVKYEDYVQNPLEYGNKFYSFFGKPTPDGWSTFVKKNMTLYSSKPSGMYGTAVENATQKAHQWKKKIKKAHLKAMNVICGDYLRNANYVL